MKWKTIAIIFIILFIVETVFFGWAMYIGQQEINKENDCIYNVCADYSSYIYDGYNSLCSCYDNGELLHTEYMK